MKFLIFSIFIFVQFTYLSQEKSDSISTILFNEFQYKKEQKRTKMQLKSKFNIFSYSVRELMHFYQNTLSEQIQADCIYEISCSQFTKKMIEKKGIIIGTLVGFHQLNNCQPNSVHDYPSHKISHKNKIINTTYFE